MYQVMLEGEWERLMNNAERALKSAGLYDDVALPIWKSYCTSSERGGRCIPLTRVSDRVKVLACSGISSATLFG